MKENSMYKRYNTEQHYTRPDSASEFYKRYEILDFLRSLSRGRSINPSAKELIDGRRKEMNDVRKGMAKNVLGIGALYSISGGLLYGSMLLIKNGWAQSDVSQAKYNEQVASLNAKALTMLTQKLTNGDPSTVRAVDQLTQNLSANGTEILNHAKNAPYLAYQSIHIIKEIVTNVGGSLTDPPITYTSAGIADGSGVTATVSVAAWHAIVQNSTAGLLVLADNLQLGHMGWVSTLEGTAIAIVGGIVGIISSFVVYGSIHKEIKEAREYLGEFKAGISKLIKMEKESKSLTEKVS